MRFSPRSFQTRLCAVALSFGFCMGALYAQASYQAEFSTQADRLKEAIENGDKTAINTLAAFYFSVFCCDPGSPYDHEGVLAKQAFAYLVKKYTTGNAELAFQLGKFYNFGIGVKESNTQAFKWWLKAAEHGHAEAQNNIGLLYAGGSEVKKDYALAMSWFLKADHQENAFAAANIGNLYYEGLGVKKDCQAALKWFYRARALGKETDRAIEEIKKDRACAHPR